MGYVNRARNLSGMASRFLIYGLFDPRTEELRYVGKSSSGLARPRVHGSAWCQKNEGHLPVHRWIKKLRDEGVAYGIWVLEETTPELLPKAEVEWISLFRDSGVRLLNVTDGGEGAAGYRQSELTRYRRSLAMRGRVLTVEHKEKISAARRKKAPRVRRAWSTGGFNEKCPCKSRAVKDDLGNVFSSVGEAARHYKVDRVAIRRVLQGKSHSSCGRTFQYIEVQ